MRVLNLFLFIVILTTIILTRLYEVQISQVQGFSIKNIMLYLVSFMLLAVHASKRTPIKDVPALVPLIIVSIFAAISMLYAPALAQDLRLDRLNMLAIYKGNIFDPVLMYIIGYFLIVSEGSDFRLIRIFVIAFGLLNVAAMSIFVTGINPFTISVVSHGGTRFASYGGISNQGAYALAFFFPLYYYLHVHAGSWVGKAFYVFLMMTTLAGIALTGSRGGYLAMAIELLLLMILTGRYAFFITMTVLGTFGVMAYAALFNWEFLVGAIGRLKLLVAGAEPVRHGFTETDTISAGRTYIWKGIYSVLKNDLVAVIIGKGCGTFAVHIKRALGGAMASHNWFLEVLLELGLIGLSLFVAAGMRMYRFFKLYLRQPDRLLYHCVFCMFFILVWTFMLSAPTVLYVTWFLTLGLLAGYVSDGKGSVIKKSPYPERPILGAGRKPG